MSEGRLKQRKIPRQQRAEVTVASIVEAAARILEYGGLDAYNTNSVARLAGISVGSLYQYFPNKDAISRALIDREAFSLLAVLERITRCRAGETAIREIVTAIVKHLMRRPNLARILDIQEQQLSLQDFVQKSETCVQSLLKVCLAESRYAALSIEPSIGWDIIGIIRGMVDGAAAKGERDIEQVVGRVQRAVEGYLTLSRVSLIS